eukprot:COSAG01_NODE_4232_length_5222_cov_3.643959_2_plen_131_part_00
MKPRSQMTEIPLHSHSPTQGTTRRHVGSRLPPQGWGVTQAAAAAWEAAPGGERGEQPARHRRPAPDRIDSRHPHHPHHPWWGGPDLCGVWYAFGVPYHEPGVSAASAPAPLTGVGAVARAEASLLEIACY